MCTCHPAPRQSVIIQIASLNKKGCRAFSRVLRAKANYRENTSEIEEKWHAQLNSTLSVTFRDNAWRWHALRIITNLNGWNAKYCKIVCFQTTECQNFKTSQIGVICAANMSQTP